MLKLPTLSAVLATSLAGLLLLGTATSQRGRPAPRAPSAPRAPMSAAPRAPVSGAPRSLPGLPTVRTVDHPALAGQPLIDNGGTAAKAAGKPKKVAPPKKRKRVDPSTRGVKKSGRDMKKAVAKVKALPWHKKIASAKAAAAKNGRPILLLQTLGDLSGFA